MAFTFKPAIYRTGILHELPRPVLSIRIQDSWDFDQFKVPLRDGDLTVGHSFQGVDISIEGQVGSRNGSIKFTEQEMFAEIELLRTVLHSGEPSEKYLLFLYHDANENVFRYYRQCSTVRFESDLSNESLYSYSTVIHADDPVIYNEPYA